MGPDGVGTGGGPSATVLCGALLPVASAIAAQGPGAGTGSAGDLTRMTMAILVYGTAAVIVGAGLIGALRRR